MPKPATPVIPGSICREVVYAKNQPEYIPLPAILLTDGTVLTRWRFSLWERVQLLISGDAWLWIIVPPGRHLQPVLLTVKKPTVADAEEAGKGTPS